MTSSHATNEVAYPLGSLPFGKDHKELLGDWWRATFSIPKQDHPMQNRDDPNKCILGYDASKKVLFLVVDDVEISKPNRTCNIPADVAIFFPIESGQCDYADDSITSDSALTNCAKMGNDGVSINSTLDGQIIPYDVNENRILTDFFNVSFAQPSNFGVDKTGQFKSQAEGYTLFLKPLAAGTHTLTYNVIVTAPFGADSSDDYVQIATYNLNVK